MTQPNRRSSWQLGHWLPSLVVGLILLIAGGLVTYFKGNNSSVATLQTQYAVQQQEIQALQDSNKALWQQLGKRP